MPEVKIFDTKTGETRRVEATPGRVIPYKRSEVVLGYGAMETDMTLRDYFAAALLSAYGPVLMAGEWSFAEAAETAYKMADAMMEARERRT